TDGRRVAAMTAATTRPARQARLIDNPELLRERLRAAPDSHGVYLMRDLDARVVYVGKAASLRSRLRSYFTAVGAQQPRTRHLVERIFDFETIACLNEREALILENTLIKRYRPRFNVRLKDDKNYLYLKIPRPGMHDVAAPGTAREDERLPRGQTAARPTLFPRPYYSRRMARGDGSPCRAGEADPRGAQGAWLPGHRPRGGARDGGGAVGARSQADGHGDLRARGRRRPRRRRLPGELRVPVLRQCRPGAARGA